MGKNDINKELEGLHFDILNDYIEKGKTDAMPEELIEYMDQLNFIQKRLHRVDSPKNVIKSLLAFYPSLENNVKVAQSRFNDALNFFYLDDGVTKEAWRNVLFEIGYKAVQVFVKTSKEPKDFLKLIDSLERLSKIKGLHLPDTEEVDPRLLEEKTEIHTLKPSDVGLPEANRHALASQIDQMPLREEQKLKLKMDAGIEPREIFEIKHEQTED